MKKIYIGFGIVATLVVAFALVNTGVLTTNVALAHTGSTTPTCTNPDPERDLSGSLTGTTGTVINKSTVCSYPVGLASYKMPDSNISHQTAVFDSELKTIAPKSTITLTVDAPSCAYQIDLFYGDLIKSFADGSRYDGRKLASEQRVNGKYGAYCVNEVPKLEIVKAAPSSINKGDDIEFTFTVKNTGKADAKNVYVSDAIQDNLVFKSVNPSNTCNVIAGRDNDIECKLGTIAAGASVTFKVTFKTGSSLSCDCKINNRAEVKADSVASVNSNTTETTVKCTPPPPPPPTFTVACAANATEVNTGVNVIWTATTNASGTKAYSWSGTDGLSGSSASVTKAYSATGTKTATISITSQGVTKTATCNVKVKAPVVIPNNPKAACVASPSSAKIGDVITWTGSATGGSGGYKYVWVGTGGLSATTSVTTKTYSTVGDKYSSVTVTDSNGKSDSVECKVTITEIPVTPVNPSVVCVANPTSGVGTTTVLWTATAAGGNNVFSYVWTGDEGLSATTATTSKTYTTVGTKNAKVVVTSNGKSASSTCSMVITATTTPPTTPPEVPKWPASVATPPSATVSVTTTTVPPQVAGVYLTQVPYTGLKENAIAAVALMAAIGSIGLIAFTYTKKRNELAYAAVASTKAQTTVPAVDSGAVLASSIESYARSQSASISADAVTAIVAASKGNNDWAKAVINQVVSAHAQNEWTLITLDSIKKIYPHIG